MRILNITSGEVIAENARIADHFLTRLKGLIFTSHSDSLDCLVIGPCKMIHTFGMKFPLDIVFISHAGTVIRTIESLQPNRISPFVGKASYVLELPPGMLEISNTKCGDKIALQ